MHHSGGLINALADVGENWRFSLEGLDGDPTQEETKSHILVISSKCIQSLYSMHNTTAFMYMENVFSMKDFT